MMSQESGKLVGKEFGNYRLIRLIGRGGFAEVYEGEHVNLPRLAAIKVLHTPLSEGYEQERFRKEARIITLLEHAHIVRILDFWVQDKTPFMVMQYAPGGSVRQQYPKRSRMPLDPDRLLHETGY